MSTIATIGIDLAKHVFHIHGIDQHGKAVLRRKLARHEMTSFLPSCHPASSALRRVEPPTTGLVS